MKKIWPYLLLLLFLILFCLWKYPSQEKYISFTAVHTQSENRLSGHLGSSTQQDHLRHAFVGERSVSSEFGLFVEESLVDGGGVVLAEKVIAVVSAKYTDAEVSYQDNLLTVTGKAQSQKALDQVSALLSHAKIPVKNMSVLDEAYIAEQARVVAAKTAAQKAEEMARLAEEKRKAEEAAEKARLAKEKQMAEEAARLAAEKKKAAEEAARLAEEKRKAEEAARLAEERRKVEEAKLAEEKRKAEEATRLLAAQKAEEAARLAEEKRKAEEAAEKARIIKEKQMAEEAARLAAEKKKAAEEAVRLAEEKRKAEEAARLAEEKRKAEEARLAEEKRKAEEATRLLAAQKAEEAARLAEEKRKAEEAAEKARLAKEKQMAEEAARLAEEKRKAEEARLAEEKRKAEEATRLLAAQKAEEAARLAEEKRQLEEAARLVAAKKKAEEEAARLAEEKRKADAEAAAEKVRLETASQARARIMHLLQNEIIEFETAKSRLTIRGAATVDKLATILQAYPDVVIEVAGHTDSDGSKAFNLKLSQKRVDSVKRELLTQGIAADRVSAKGYGESRPLVPNTTRANKQKNRRVEIIVVGE